MKHRCPKCGHQWEEPSANQSKGGKARWKVSKKKERSEAARKAAQARWAGRKQDGSSSNVEMSPGRSEQ